MSEFTHIRRCHHCGEISENANHTVERCDFCGKPLAKFYFFDETILNGWCDDAQTPPHQESDYRPIYGLTAFW